MAMLGQDFAKVWKCQGKRGSRRGGIDAVPGGGHQSLNTVVESGT